MVTPDAVSQDVDVLRRLADYHQRPGARGACALPAHHPAGLGRGAMGPSWSGPRTWLSSWGPGWSWCMARSAGSGTTPGTSPPGWPGCRADRRAVRGGEHETAAGPGRRGRAVRPVLEPGPDGLPARDPGPVPHCRVRVRRARHGRRARRTAPRTCTWPTAPGCPTATSTWSPAAAASRARRCCTGWPPKTTRGWSCWEVKTFRAPTQEARYSDLAEALEFARGHLAAPGEAPTGAAPSGPPRASPSAAPPRVSPARFGMTAHPLTTSR